MPNYFTLQNYNKPIIYTTNVLYNIFQLFEKNRIVATILNTSKTARIGQPITLQHSTYAAAPPIQ